MNERIHKPKSGESGGQQTHRPNSLVGSLIRELSGAPVGADESVRPVCKRCHDSGASSDDLYIDAGEPVYVCLYWEEWSGWRTLGVYHAAHTESIRSLLADPQKPLIAFEAVYEELTRDETEPSVPSTYVLTDLSYIDMMFPRELVEPSGITL